MERNSLKTGVVVMSMMLGLAAAQAATYSVSNASSLQSALNSAVAGDVINLADGTYDAYTVSGNKLLMANRNGAKNNPITIQGGVNAVIKNSGTGGGHYAIHLDNVSYVKLSGFTVDGAMKGIMVDASNNVVIDNIKMKNIGQEGVHFRKDTSYSSLTNSTITYTGKSNANYGEGIYVGTAESNWSSVMGSNIPDPTRYIYVCGNSVGPYVTAEHMDIKEGSSYVYVLNNTFDNSRAASNDGTNYADSAIDAKGHRIYIRENVFKNSVPTYIDSVVNGSGTVQYTKVTADAVQTHKITTSPSTTSGTNIYMWKNNINLRSSSKPSGYLAGTGMETDGNGTNYFCNDAGLTNTVASGDIATEASSNNRSCSTAISAVPATCPNVLAQ